MTNKEFKEKLDKCTIERQVEDVYNEMLKQSFPGIDIQYPYNCDGYFETKHNDKDLYCLCEFKYDYNLKSKNDISKIICQVLAYLKKFDLDGKKLPNVIVIADVNECFVIPTSCLVKYLDNNTVNWDIAPSSFFDNVDLLNLLIEDESICPWTFDVKDDFDFNNVVVKITSYLDSIPKLVDINVHNIDGIFKDFETRVLKDKKLNSNQKVQCFIGTVTNDENYYLHPRKKNILVIPGDVNNEDSVVSVKIDTNIYSSFKKQFDTNITLTMKRKITALTDRLLEDTSRRLKGEFYSPTPFVDYAHNMISQHLGENWKNEYVVWDPAWGTGNLTRDYSFNELYCSTLEQADLNIGAKYNVGSVKFQFDFLNDGLEKIPDGLIKAFQENKKIVFFLNPPYGTTGNLSKNGNKKSGMCKTNINKEMLNLKFGNSCENLYAQFLYRICKIKRQFSLNECYLAFICKPGFMTITSYKKFREMFLNNFDYIDSCMINAKYFGASDIWGITFTVFKCKVNEEEI